MSHYLARKVKGTCGQGGAAHRAAGNTSHLDRYAAHLDRQVTRPWPQREVGWMTGRSGRAGYTAIAEHLRRQIQTGVLTPGQALPSLQEICTEWEVSMNTARAALTSLTQQGLIESRQGARAQVRGYARIRSRRIQRLTPGQWSGGASIWDADVTGRNLRQDPVEVDVVTPPETVARALGLEPDALAVRRRRRFFVDDRPVQTATSWLPAELVAGTRIVEPDTGPGGTYARLAELGAGPVAFREEVIARMPDSAEEAALDLRPGTPVVSITRTAWDAGGRVVEANEMLMDAGAYVLDYTWGER